MPASEFAKAHRETAILEADYLAVFFAGKPTTLRARQPRTCLTERRAQRVP